MTKIKFFTLFVTLVASFGALSHTGHDHNSPWSGLVHLLWLSPIFVAAAVYFIKERKHQSQVEQMKQEGKQ